MSELSPIQMSRLVDISRGSFEVTGVDPPNGVRRPDKTAQDRMPVQQRPRVKEAQRRLELRKAGH